MGALGERLRREREKKKISLDDIALSTKISARMLRAIEEERFDQLPGGIFNKGFVRAYARHLGLDENDAVADYLAADHAGQPDETQDTARMALEVQAQKRPRRADQIPWGKIAGALLLLAFGFALWGSYSREMKSRLRAAASTKPAASAPATNSGHTVASPPPSVAPPPSAADDKSTPATGQPATAKPTSSGPAATPAASDDASAAGFRVLIRARQDSWIQITADGKEVMNDTLPAHAEKSVTARGEMVVKTGNIGGLDFWFNGQKLPSQGGAGEVKTLFFESSGLVASTATVSAPASSGQTQP